MTDEDLEDEDDDDCADVDLEQEDDIDDDEEAFDDFDEADDEEDDCDELDDGEAAHDEALDDEDAFDGGGYGRFEHLVFDDEDADDAREPVWKGFFSDDIKDKIRAALRIAERQARRAKCVFDKIVNQRGGLIKKARRRRSAYFRAPFVHQFFGRGAVTGGEIRRMHRRIKRIERALRKRRIRFNRAAENVGRCAGGSSAFTTAAGGIRRLHVCTKFLNKDPESMARTIIHELVHEIGFCHYSTTGRVRCTSAGAKTAQECVTLARRHPRRARKNPQNYVWLFERLSKSSRTGC